MLDVQRKELKYLVNVVEMTRLQNTLSQNMTEDSHNNSNGYRVRSLYFDTLQDRDYEEKVNGCDLRQKIRIRIYDNNVSIIKLELKKKESDRQRKFSIFLSKEEAEQMMKAEYGFLLKRPEKMAQSVYTMLTTNCYRPKCIVEYDRIAYLRDTHDTRVTFDCNLRATESNLNLFDTNLMLYPVCKTGQITMEVKYNGFLLSYIKDAVNRANKTQVSNSKYCRARKISKRGRI